MSYRPHGFCAVAVVAAISLALGARAQEACLDQTWECLLAEALKTSEDIYDSFDRDEVYFEGIKTYLAFEKIVEARETSLKIANPITHAEAERTIAEVLARLGDFDGARATAFEILDSRNDSARIRAFEAIAVEEARAGNVESAFDTVIAIDNPYRRSQAQAAIAETVALDGDLDAAIRAATRIATDYWFNDGQPQFKIASGVVSRASEFDDYWFYHALVRIAAIQCQNGNDVGATQTARAIPDLVARSAGFTEIARAQAGRGDIENALATARLVEAAYGDQDALLAVVGAIARSGDLEHAEELARDILDSYGSDRGFVHLAAGRAADGDLEGALAEFGRLTNVESKALAAQEISVNIAEQGNLWSAIALIQQIPEIGVREETFRQLAIELVNLGRKDEALSLAREFGSNASANELIYSILEAQALQGDQDNAIQFARNLPDPMARGIALALIARVLG
jgi:tetratricopeptide (TPR) repeat protein